MKPVVIRLERPEELAPFEPGLRFLLAWYEEELADAGCGGAWQGLLENITCSLPWIWMLVSREYFVPLAVASLTDICPGRHVFLHGISHPAIRQCPERGRWTAMLAYHVMRFAFDALNVLKVKAEFDADNRGARGFCLRMGFRPEARFRADVLVHGQVKDVLIYTIDQACFHQRHVPHMAKAGDYIQ